MRLANYKAILGSFTAILGTESAQIIRHLKNGMIKQPAALSSHFCVAKDERELRARDRSLDSEKWNAFASTIGVMQ